MGNETEFETRNWREMGNKTEFETRNGRKWETKRYKIHHFSTKARKTGKNLKTGEKTVKNWGEKNRNFQEIQKQDFDKVPGNAEYGNEFSARFREMLKTETRIKTRSSRMSRNDNSRAKTMYRPTPRPAYVGIWPKARLRALSGYTIHATMPPTVGCSKGIRDAIC